MKLLLDFLSQIGFVCMSKQKNLDTKTILKICHQADFFLININIFSKYYLIHIF